jgi:predicted DNA-binding ribbon-helix-helix protein
VATSSNNPITHHFNKVDANGHLKSMVIKHSLLVGGHRSSVSLEGAFWNELRGIARERNVSLSQLVGTIDSEREHANLSSAIRIFVFEQRRNHHQGAANKAK